MPPPPPPPPPDENSEERPTAEKAPKRAWSKPTIRRLLNGVVVVESGPIPANWVTAESNSYTPIS